MSYDASAYYVAENVIENYLKELLRPIAGNNPGRNAPLIRFIHDFGEKLISSEETTIDQS